MKRQFVINLILLVVLNLLIKPIWILLDIKIQNTVGTDEYGLFFALFNFSMIFNLLLDLGISNYNNKEIAGNEDKFETYFKKLIPVRFVLGVGYMLVLILAGFLIGYDGQAIFMLSLLGVNQVMLSFILYVRSNFQGLHLFRSDSLVSIIDRTLMIVLLCFLLFGSDQLDIIDFVYTQTIGYVVAAVLALALLLFQKKKAFGFNIDIEFSKKFIKKSFPYALIVVLMQLYSYSDSVMLERILPDGKIAAGIYAQSFRLLLAVINFAYLFSVLLLPMFSRMISNREKVNSLVKISSLILIVNSLFVVQICYLFKEEFIDIFYGSGIAGIDSIIGNLDSDIQLSAQVFGIVMLNIIPMATMYIFGTLLTAKGDMKFLNTTAFIGIIINIIGNFILIPQYGVLGAAIISLITQTIVCGLQVVRAFRKFELSIDYVLLIRIVILAIISTIMASSFSLPFNWLVNAASLLLLNVIISVILGIFPKEEILKLKRIVGTGK